MEISKKDIFSNLREKPYVGCSVYFLTKGDEVIYVGQTRHGMTRIYSHAKTKDFDGYYLHPVKSEKDLDFVELQTIVKHKPRLNKSIASLGGYTLEKINTLYKQMTGRRNRSLIEKYIIDNDVKGTQLGARLYFTYEQAVKICEDLAGAK